ncbi:unnamed protein product [Dimorphilus gyrociliatus]|uniref:Uncharacterized protein n=1 Tax=Dimorphilus gyrociliatus TaxID=2664684 RepID=A0A7I8VXB1_9ANNE|nr:unnamed protein product [Dimorphilus gyrociliatus]
MTTFITTLFSKMSFNSANSLLPMNSKSRKFRSYDRLDSSGMEIENKHKNVLRKTTSDSGASFISFQHGNSVMANKAPEKLHKSSLHPSTSCPSFTLVCNVNVNSSSPDSEDPEVDTLNHQNITFTKKKRKKRPSKRKRLKLRLTKLRENSIKKCPTKDKFCSESMNKLVHDFCVRAGDDCNDDEDWSEFEDGEAFDELNDDDDLDSSEFNQIPTKTRRVRFPSGDKIHVIHEIEDFSDKFNWHFVDKQRFKNRIESCTPIISPCLAIEHRRKMYKKLFGADLK